MSETKQPRKGEREACVVCDKEPVYRWCDMHGVAQCVSCGTPYRLFHYEDDKRVEKDPLCLIDAAAIPFYRRMFAETGGARLSAVGLGLSVPGGYDIASRDDTERICKWWTANETAADCPR